MRNTPSPPRSGLGSWWWREKTVEKPLAFFACKRGEDSAELFLAYEDDGKTGFFQVGGFPYGRGDVLAALNRGLPHAPEPAKKPEAKPAPVTGGRR